MIDQSRWIYHPSKSAYSYRISRVQCTILWNITSWYTISISSDWLKWRFQLLWERQNFLEQRRTLMSIYLLIVGTAVKRHGLLGHSYIRFVFESAVIGGTVDGITRRLLSRPLNLCK